MIGFSRQSPIVTTHSPLAPAFAVEKGLKNDAPRYQHANEGYKSACELVAKDNRDARSSHIPEEEEETSGLAVVAFAAEQVGHDLHVGIAGMIEAGNLEARLQRLGE